MILNYYVHAKYDAAKDVTYEEVGVTNRLAGIYKDDSRRSGEVVMPKAYVLERAAGRKLTSELLVEIAERFVVDWRTKLS